MEKLQKSFGKAVEKLEKSCRKAVEKLQKSCGKAVGKLRKSCRKAVKKLWITQNYCLQDTVEQNEIITRELPGVIARTGT